jgi:ABC-type multidrug transport system fused ATPase/permease subunit
VQRLDMSLFERHSSGGLMRVPNDDVHQLERFLDVGANDILQFVTTVTLLGAISVGICSTLVFTTQRLLWPLTRLGQTFDLCRRATASTRRFFGLLDETPEMRDGPLPLPPDGPRGELRLEGIIFGYGGGTPVLRDLDLVVPAGSTTIVIAHRPSTIRHADRIHVLEHGRRIGSGRHEEPRAADGVDAGPWRVQTGARAPAR